MPRKKKEPDPPCMFCGEPGGWLCDFTLGRDRDEAKHPGEKPHGKKKGWAPGEMVDLEDPTFTCDASMCSKCTHTFGHICGRGPKKFHDTIDSCPVHKDLGLGDMRGLLTKEDAAAYRARMKLAVENGRMPTHRELAESVGIPVGWEPSED